MTWPVGWKDWGRLELIQIPEPASAWLMLFLMNIMSATIICCLMWAMMGMAESFLLGLGNDVSGTVERDRSSGRRGAADPQKQQIGDRWCMRWRFG
jgi:hypothetical protein